MKSTRTVLEIHKILQKIVPNLQGQVSQASSPSIQHITLDSRKVRPQSMFVALRGEHHDGIRFIPEAVKRGAVALLCEDPSGVAQWFSCGATGPAWWTPQARQAVAMLVREFYADFLSQITVIAVTGTKGKTTIVHWLHDTLRRLGKRAARVGTLGADPPYENMHGLTTPESTDLAAYTVELVQNDFEFLAIEASSIGLDRYRLDSLRVHTAAFTNLGHDHLDYHKTMESYFESKSRLFLQSHWNLHTAVININDSWGRKLHARIPKTLQNIITIGLKHDTAFIPDILGEIHEIDLSHARGTLLGKKMPYPIPWNIKTGGKHNVLNFLTVLACLMQFFDPSHWKVLVEAQGQFTGAPGRLQTIPLPNEALAIIDYAHTPESLEVILQTVKAQTHGRLFTVFGCGGNRDKDKRPRMGQIALQYSDFVIITDDNPRHEDPEEIVQHILLGCDAREGKGKIIVIHDRKAAIQHALALSNPKDIILIAGKGHETYQIYGDTVQPHSDAGIVEQWSRKDTAHVDN